MKFKLLSRFAMLLVVFDKFDINIQMVEVPEP